MSLNNQNNQRSDRLAKRRKTNTILNSLIAIVIVLIIIVSYRIFFAADEPPVDKNGVSEETTANKGKDDTTTVKDDKNKDQSENTEKSTEATDKEDQTDQEDSDGELIVEESSEENVEQTIRNPQWKAVGTEQTNGHQYSTSNDSLDWKEKELALSYATDVPVDNMVIWWLERGPDGDHQAVGTISPKDAQSDVYRVHLEWEDGNGWKPTIVKKLIKNDKRR